jgi:hypothetical protein
MFFAGLLLAVLVLITYSGATKNEFVGWDDSEYVVNNNLVRNPGDKWLKDIFTTVVSLNYHPITIMSLRLNNNDCKTCPNSISPKPFIRGNVALHLLNALLVFILIYLLTNRNILVSFLVAAVFGVHPMHVESVVWISERKDVLYSFFFLAGLISYIYFKKDDRKRYIWLIFSFILFVFSCLSKATAVIFPVVLILIDFWLYKTEEDKPALKALDDAFSVKNLLLLLPFFIVSVFIGIIAFKVQNGDNIMGMLNFSKSQDDVVNSIGHISVLQRFQIASYGFIVYIIKFFVPGRLSALYPYPGLPELSHGTFAITLWMTTAAVILIAFLVIRSLRSSRLFLFGTGFYFVTIVLVLQFVSVGTNIMAERYSYLPYIGLSFIPATLIAGSSGTLKKILLVISGCFIIILIILSNQQIRIWRNTETLWTNVIEKHPHLELPRRGRGKYYYMMSSHAKNDTEKRILEDKALSDFKEAIKAGTKSLEVYEGTGVIYQLKGDPEHALPFLNKALSLDPKKGRTYYNRAMVYDMLNKKEESIKDYSSALVYSPEMTLEILSNRSVLYIETGRFREAISDLDSLISINSRNFMYYSNRAYSKLQLKDIAGAIDDYGKVLQLNPGDKETERQLQALLDLKTKKDVINK